MKLGTPLFILLVIAFAFTAISLIVGDFRTNYPEANVSTESYESKYNYQEQVNGTFWDLSSRLEDISEAEGGWKIWESVVAIPFVVITVILQIIRSIPYLTAILSGIPNDLGVPTPIIAIGLTAVMAGIIIMLIKFVHKSTTP